MGTEFYPRLRLCVVSMLLLLLLPALAGTAPVQRVANKTLKMPPAPPQLGYASSNAFGTMTFTNPVAIVSAPGETNRLFILEKRGRIIAITNLAAPTRTVFMDITNQVLGSDVVSDERGLLGLAFHPGFATNGYFYVFYTGTATTSDSGGANMHDILSRFQVSAADPNQGDPASEVRLIQQYDEADNHNAGDLHFGPDGYLYVSLGDEGGANGEYGNAQRIDKDYFSGILRIDVDMLPGNLPPNPHPSTTPNYLVPADNPFVGATKFNGLSVDPNNVRTEFWAVGLRNPWRFSFDYSSGTVYCGDVGQNTREEIDIIVKGGNYGWNFREGNIAFPGGPTPPPGFVETKPLLDYPRTAGYCVIGGVVYRGTRMSQLYGAYIYGDYGSGAIWALRNSGTNVTQNALLMSDAGITAFGIDPSNGDILYANQHSGPDGTISRIYYTDTSTGAPLPPTLADTGAFSDLGSLTVEPGILPYSINVPFWSDNAIKTRWFSIPNPALKIGFNRDIPWSFPTGAVWIKHFELELVRGDPSSRRRLETRFIVKNSGGVYGVTYRWDDSMTNATLVPEEGMDENFVIDDGGGITRTQVWHYPSRSECLACHTGAGGYALGFNTAQMNHDADFNGIVTNQIAALNQAGYFSAAIPAIATLPALISATNDSVSLEKRVRSYLAANCVQCHQPAGGAQALWDARYSTPTLQAGIVNGALINNGGDTNNRVLKPLSLEHSMMLTRISTRGPGQMPPLATSVLDEQDITLLSTFITNRPSPPLMLRTIP
jgi:glucose/arabinose dehydrogenase/mono/diheme cytochrome c family protein